eukprot:4249858-Alexandrium_andersonii.AAC.1
MSASLVGSEMCIRDSVWYSRVLRFLDPSPHASHASALQSRTSVPEHSKAVSYTHLTLPTICSV